jgi:hypothetical protein
MAFISESLLSSLIWTDFRLAVLLTVLVPLVLLIWAFVQRSDGVLGLMVIYWRVASLLAITVYLMIVALPISFASGWLARVLIPVSLWFWVDLNDDVADMAVWKPLRLAFTSWRWAVSIYCGIGAIFSATFLDCALRDRVGILGSRCALWLNPPYGFKQIFHANTDEKLLGFFGIVGLIVYVLCFGYFTVVRLGRQGRSATGR